MTTNRGFVRASVLAVVAAVMAVSFVAAEQTADLSSSQDFSVASETREVEVEVGADARSVAVTAKMDIEKGRASFRLLDPSGAERLTGACTAGHCAWESGQLPALPGVWRARFDLERATGKFRVRSQVR